MGKKKMQKLAKSMAWLTLRTMDPFEMGPDAYTNITGTEPTFDVGDNKATRNALTAHFVKSLEEDFNFTISTFMWRLVECDTHLECVYSEPEAYFKHLRRVRKMADRVYRPYFDDILSIDVGCVAFARKCCLKWWRYLDADKFGVVSNTCFRVGHIVDPFYTEWDAAAGQYVAHADIVGTSKGITLGFDQTKLGIVVCVLYVHDNTVSGGTLSHTLGAKPYAVTLIPNGSAADGDLSDLAKQVAAQANWLAEKILKGGEENVPSLPS